MSQSDFSLANQAGAPFRAELNDALQALASLSKGNSAPGTPYSGQLWWDTANNLIKIRNNANSAWNDAFYYDGTVLYSINGGHDPEHATDGGTDTYASATTTSTPGDGVVIIRDFQSANTTTTPTLDGNSITTKDGSALWGGAIDGVHSLQWDNGNSRYLLLKPQPIDEDDMASDSDAAVPTQQSVKAYADTKLQKPGTSSNPALALDTWRTPNADRLTQIVFRLIVETDGSSFGEVFLDVDESGGTTADYSLSMNADNDLPSGTALSHVGYASIPPGASYRFRNALDPNSSNQISNLREFTL